MSKKKSGILIFTIFVIFVIFVTSYLVNKNLHYYTKEIQAMVYEIDTFITPTGKYQRGLMVYDSIEEHYIYLVSDKYKNTNNKIFNLSTGDEITIEFDLKTNKIINFGYKILQ